MTDHEGSTSTPSPSQFQTPTLLIFMPILTPRPPLPEKHRYSVHCMEEGEKNRHYYSLPTPLHKNCRRVNHRNGEGEKNRRIGVDLNMFPTEQLKAKSQPLRYPALFRFAALESPFAR
jgi:hypothetical protein